MYKYLLFDIDGTLMDFDHDMDYAFRYMYEHSGLSKSKPLTEELMEQYEKHNKYWWRCFEQGKCSKVELFNNRFVDFFEEANLPSLDPNWINELYFDALGKTGTLLSGAEKLLSDLHVHYKLYIVTNGNAASQKTRLERSGILRYIENYFISETTGYAKPDKRYFDYVLSHIPGAKPKDCIVIGDSLSSDMLGALNAGMDSIWYNPKGLAADPKIPVTHEVETLDSIRNILLSNK